MYSLLLSFLLYLSRDPAVVPSPAGSVEPDMDGFGWTAGGDSPDVSGGVVGGLVVLTARSAGKKI